MCIRDSRGGARSTATERRLHAKGGPAVINVARHQSVFSLSSEAAPVARIRPGDSLVLDTADCFSDQVQSAEDTPGAVDWGHINPATGPVFVEGAEPGDVLSVLVEHIDVAHSGVMAVSGEFGVLRERFQGMSFEMIPIEDRFARVAGASIPVRPMIGVIGVAPAGSPVPCGSPCLLYTSPSPRD